MNGTKGLRFVIMFAIALAFFQSVALAEIMRAEVRVVNQDQKSITINQLDQSGVGVTRENLKLNLRDDTQFTGIKSIQDLKVGDEVLIEANKRIFGPWEIKHLQSTKPSAAVAQSAKTAAKTAMAQKSEVGKALGQAQKAQSEAQKAQSEVGKAQTQAQTALKANASQSTGMGQSPAVPIAPAPQKEALQ